MRRADAGRLAVHAALLIAIALPRLRPAWLEVEPGPPARAFHAAIESLAPGSRLLLSLDFAPATALENRPMAEAVLRHALARGCRVVLMSLWPTGPPLIERLTRDVIDDGAEELRYGHDYIDLGFKAGGPGVVQALLADFTAVMSTEADGADSRGFAIMQGIERVSDFDLVVAIGAGSPGVREWVRFAGDPSGLKLIAGVTAVETPLVHPYYPRQLAGLIGGLWGAAEYEALLAERLSEPAPARGATRHTASQAGAQAALVLLMLLSRARGLRDRRRGARAR